MHERGARRRRFPEGGGGGGGGAMKPQGHLSRHPSAFDIAGSVISLTPVLSDEAPVPRSQRPLPPLPQQLPHYPPPYPLSSSSSSSSPPRSPYHKPILPPFPHSSLPDTPPPRFPPPRSRSHSFSNEPPVLQLPPLKSSLREKSRRKSSNLASGYVAAPMLSPDAAPSPSGSTARVAPFRDDANYVLDDNDNTDDFLRQRRVLAAGFLHSDDHSIDDVRKRRARVDAVVTRAKERISQLGLEVHAQKHRGKDWMWGLRQRLRAVNSFWGLWGEELKEIEGSFGSAMMITFAFLRWVFILDVCLATLWIVAVVVPFFLDPPSSFDWSEFRTSFQDNGLEKTWVYLGGYFYKSEQTGWYRTEYVYPCTIAAMFLISLLAILATVARRTMGSGDASMVYINNTSPYATLVFTAWDFRITSIEAARKLRKGIRMQLREMLADSLFKDQNKNEESKWKYYKRYMVLGVMWPTVMAGTITSVFFLVSKSDNINTKFKTGYAQSVLMTILVSIIGPCLVRLLVTWEGWKPAVAERVVIIKLFFLRALNLSAFLYRLYAMLQAGYLSMQSSNSQACVQNIDCPIDGFLCCNSPTDGIWGTCTQSVGFCASKCMENEVGKQILKLIITTTIINSLLDIGLGVLFGVLLNKEQELSIPDFAIDTIYLQVLIWIGSHFSPVAATIGVMCHLLTFYAKKVTLKTCTSMQKLYSASRTSILTYGVLFMALILCIIPEAAFVTIPSSGICGPIKASETMYGVLANYIEHAGNPLGIILQWIGSPVILGGVIIILIFVIILLRGRLAQSYQYLEMRRKEEEYKEITPRKR